VAKQTARLRLVSCRSTAVSAVGVLRTLWWGHQCLDEAENKKDIHVAVGKSPTVGTVLVRFSRD